MSDLLLLSCGAEREKKIASAAEKSIRFHYTHNRAVWEAKCFVVSKLFRTWQVFRENPPKPVIMSSNPLPPRVLSVQVGQPQTRTRPDGKTWRSAIGKTPVAGAVFLGRENVAGDRQSNRKYHGGADKAVCVYSSEHYDRWRDELSRPDQAFGSFGENLTTAGLLETEVYLGDVYTFASGAAIQVCQGRVPCANVAHYWDAPELPARMRETGFTGFYCRVLTEGVIESGDALTLADRVFPEWTIARANRAYYGRRSDAVTAERVALIALGAPVSPEAVAHTQKLLQ